MQVEVCFYNEPRLVDHVTHLRPIFQIKWNELLSEERKSYISGTAWVNKEIIKIFWMEYPFNNKLIYFNIIFKKIMDQPDRLAQSILTDDTAPNKVHERTKYKNILLIDQTLNQNAESTRLH